MNLEELSTEPHPTPKKRASLLSWLASAQSFTLSALIHACLLLTLGGTVLFHQISEPPDFQAEADGLVSNDPVATPPQQQQPQMTQPTYSGAAPSTASVASAPSQFAALTTTNLTTSTFNMASMATNV